MKHLKKNNKVGFEGLDDYNQKFMSGYFNVNMIFMDDISLLKHLNDVTKY